MNETKLPIWHTAWFSWRDGLRAARAMPKLAAIIFALILVDSSLDEFLRLDEFEEPVLWRQILRVAVVVPFTLFMAPLQIAFYRYLLLEEVSQGYVLDLANSRFRMFFGYSAAVGVITAACFYFVGSAGWLVDAFGIVAGVVVMLFTAMLFPAIAVDATAANVMNAAGDLQPLRALVIGLVALLTWVLVPVLSLSVLLWKIELPTPDAEQAAQVVILSVFGFVLEMIALVLSAQFYRAWAHRLGRPAGVTEKV